MVDPEELAELLAAEEDAWKVYQARKDASDVVRARWLDSLHALQELQRRTAPPG